MSIHNPSSTRPYKGVVVCVWLKGDVTFPHRYVQHAKGDLYILVQNPSSMRPYNGVVVCIWLKGDFDILT